MLEDTRFWQLVAVLGGRPEEQDDEPYECLSDRLAAGPVVQIIDFAETLAVKLYKLDRRVFADVPPADGSGGLSDDGFLYARCAVVVAGPESFAAVLADPASFARFGTSLAQHAESLLDVPSNAYERKTGEKWDHVEEYDYETGSNEQYW